jgi:hypothetical protein
MLLINEIRMREDLDVSEYSGQVAAISSKIGEDQPPSWVKL